MCVHAYAYLCVHVTVQIWRSKDNFLELGPSFHHVDYESGVFRSLGCQYLLLVTYLSGSHFPHFLFYYLRISYVHTICLAKIYPPIPLSQLLLYPPCHYTCLSNFLRFPHPSLCPLSAAFRVWATYWSGSCLMEPHT